MVDTMTDFTEKQLQNLFICQLIYLLQNLLSSIIYHTTVFTSFLGMPGLMTTVERTLHN